MCPRQTDLPVRIPRCLVLQGPLCLGYLFLSGAIRPRLLHGAFLDLLRGDFLRCPVPSLRCFPGSLRGYRVLAPATAPSDLGANCPISVWQFPKLWLEASSLCCGNAEHLLDVFCEEEDGYFSRMWRSWLPGSTAQPQHSRIIPSLPGSSKDPSIEPYICWSWRTLTRWGCGRDCCLHLADFPRVSLCRSATTSRFWKFLTQG